MPEGPEVRVLASYVSAKCVGKKILDIELANWTKKVVGYESISEYLDTSQLQIIDVFPVGKILCICVGDTGTGTGTKWIIHMSFGLVGEVCIYSDAVNAMLYKIGIHLDSDEIIGFNDKLNFGNISILTPAEHKVKVSKLGPDMCLPDADALCVLSYVKYKISKLRSDWEIGDLLLDQKIFLGVGNYIRSDALYMAGITPMTTVASINDSDMLTLLDAIKSVMDISYTAQMLKLKLSGSYDYNTLKSRYKCIAYKNPKLTKHKMKRSKRFVWF
jgi:formamidopyrimidine-DNA glycosylase